MRLINKRKAQLALELTKQVVHPVGLFVSTVLINWMANYWFSRFMGLDYEAQKLKECLDKLQEYVKLEREEMAPLLRQLLEKGKMNE